MAMKWALIERDEVDSTQSVASELASKGAPEGTTIVAKSQSAGRGRLGRAWVSPPGGLYMSFILRPGRIGRPEAMPLIGALAVVNGVNSLTGLRARIRWPNDIMVGSKKLGGVIAVAETYGREVTWVLVGVGVNCNAPISGLQTAGEATSIAEEVGKDVEIRKVRDSILESFSRLYERFRAGDDLAPLWKESVSTIGKSVTVKMRAGETPFSCDAVGIASDGGLVVSRSGVRSTVLAEEIEWLRETG